jgi:Cas6b C-terminal domain
MATIKKAAAKKVTVKKTAAKKAAAKPTRKPTTSGAVATCTLTFPFSITAAELSGFRGAIIKAVEQLKEIFAKAGLATDLFHNHDEEDGRQLLRHPAIVYQLMRDNGDGEPQPGYLFPAIAASGPGVAALQLLAANMPARLVIYRRQFATRGFVQQQATHTVALQKTLSEYALYKWLALNPDNYTRYKTNLRFTARVEMLNEILKKNILGWYAAAGHTLPEKDLQVFITEITAINHDGAEHNGRRMFVFDCTFATNLALPKQMAIGNGTAKGFGKIRPLKSTAAHIIALQHTAAVL